MKQEATLSKKRLLLEKNLKAVVKKVEMGKTPLRIAELWVYGSFIRPKEDPGDVDLVLFYRPDEELDRKVSSINEFLHHHVDSVEGFSKLVWNQEFEGQVDALVEALSTILGPDERYRPWLEPSRARWVHGVRSYGIWVLTLEMNRIVKSILLGKSRTIHIDPTLGIRSIAERDEALAERPHRMLWGESSPDVEANLRLMRTAAEEAADKELPRFLVQFDQLDAEYSMVKAGISYVLAEIKQGRDVTRAKDSEIFDIAYADPSWGREAKRLRTYKVNSPMEAGMVSWARKNGVDEDFIGAALSASPVAYMQQFLPDKPARVPLPEPSTDVEELRSRSKELTRKLPFARSLKSSMSNLGDRNEFSAEDPIAEAVYLAYVRTEMYLAPDEVRTEVLRDLGLSQIVIAKRSEKGQPFDRYGQPGEQL
ncbi:MAG: hypothetical protein HY296_03610 [Thaumarchaeota archaeon]|nr:hypothetical protein [Nitrososphaerota archaeon]